MKKKQPWGPPEGMGFVATQKQRGGGWRTVVHSTTDHDMSDDEWNRRWARTPSWLQSAGADTVPPHPTARHGRRADRKTAQAADRALAKAVKKTKGAW